jgi:hypothetical protein
MRTFLEAKIAEPKATPQKSSPTKTTNGPTKEKSYRNSNLLEVPKGHSPPNRTQSQTCNITVEAEAKLTSQCLSEYSGK